ncbi:unnamed protein product [Blepharisma stoltei]|uniref:Uncharacterized protein n=1 Tax=Blepharisma stoltei TaxID=1481888 RepID=A0AAU9IEZ7_9CILI|nr:unnamed protein product [Blepharisma stoltei]
MNVRVINSTFSKETKESIIQVLKQTTDTVEIRDILKRLIPDLWVVVAGKSFAYSISRATKSSGLFGVTKPGEKEVKFLIYTPPHSDFSSFIPPPFKNDEESTSKITTVKSTIKDKEMLDEIISFLSKADYKDTTKACELIKAKLIDYEDHFWHVFIGKDFVCTLPQAEPEYLLYVKAKESELDIVIFRQKGVKREVKWTGILTWVLYVCFSFVLFLGLMGLIKCHEGSTSWVCEHHKSLLYIALSMIMSKGVKTIVAKFYKVKQS